MEGELVIEEGPVTRPAPARRRHPADDLGERITLMRRVADVPPTIPQLQRHAERYGPDAVVETAVELGYGLDPCVRLQDACDRIGAAEVRGRRHGRTVKLAPSEDRVKVLMGLDRQEDPA